MDEQDIPQLEDESTKSPNHVWIILAVVITILIAIVISSYVWYKLDIYNKKQALWHEKIDKYLEENPEPTVSDREPIERFTSNYDYYYRIDSYSSNQEWVQSLVQIEMKNNQEQIIIKDINKQYGKFFTILGKVEGANLIILKETVPDTDFPAKTVYSLNIDTLELKKLKINEIIPSREMDFGVQALSQDGKWLAWIPLAIDQEIAQKLYVGNLIDDSYKLKTQLSGLENFNRGNQGLSAVFDMYWISRRLLACAFFNINENGPNDFIDYKTFIIK